MKVTTEKYSMHDDFKKESSENMIFSKYPKIDSIFKRNMSNKDKPLMVGDFSCREFGYLSGNEWEVTEKVDGMNVRVLWDGEGFTFGGRTDKDEMPPELIDYLKSIFDKEKFSLYFGKKNIMIYGEGFGGKIQYGAYPIKNVRFIVFDVSIGKFWLNRVDLFDICEKLGLELVPLVGYYPLSLIVERVKRGLQSIVCPEVKMEGVIAKTPTGILSRNGNRIITKIKWSDFK